MADDRAKPAVAQDDPPGALIREQDQDNVLPTERPKHMMSSIQEKGVAALAHSATDRRITSTLEENKQVLPHLLDDEKSNQSERSNRKVLQPLKGAPKVPL